jgi:hypothetical protein
MPTSYTSLLGLALPVEGELAGEWGDVVNNFITQYVDAAVAGTQAISGSQTAVTLSKTTDASLAQAGSGATGSAQYQVINCTGNPASTLTVSVDYSGGATPLSNSQFTKTYIVLNATSTSQSVVVRAITSTGTSTGVTLVSGEKAVIAWNGSDFVKVATSTADGVTTISFGTTGLTPNSATSGAVSVAGTLVAANGGTGQSNYTTGDTLYASGSTALSKLGIGSSGQVLTVAGGLPTWATPASGLPSQTGNAGKYLTTDGTNASWSSTGAAAGGAIYVNNTTISQNYTIASGQNGFTVGPVTIDSGYSVTVSSGQRWVVL